MKRLGQLWIYKTLQPLFFKEGSRLQLDNVISFSCLSNLSLLCIVCGMVAPNTWAAEPTPTRQTELRHLLKNDCGACHGLTLQGGMGPPLLPNTLKDKADALLITSILQGRKGTAMPPWQAFISPEEAAWLLEVLRNGTHDSEKTN